MPNPPPVGAAIDAYLYLWVIVAAISACVIVVIAWVRQARQVLVGEWAARDAESGQAEESSHAS